MSNTLTTSKEIMETVREADPLSVVLLAACLLLGMLAHLFSKVAKVNDMSDGNFNAGKFFRKEWPYIFMSLCAMAILLIAHENIAKLKFAGEVVGEWMYLVFAFFGWTSDSLLYKFFGSTEKGLIKKMKDDSETAKQ
jgi:nitrate reductase gamma subunit